MHLSMQRKHVFRILSTHMCKVFPSLMDNRFTIGLVNALSVAQIHLSGGLTNIHRTRKGVSKKLNRDRC